MNCGVDIAKINRFENPAQNDKFFEKYFTDSEKEYVLKKLNKAETLAGLFCAKEAVLKALGLGVGSGINLKEVAILHSDLGMPYVDVNAKIFYYLQQKNCSEISLSISHDGEYAVAFCVIS